MIESKHTPGPWDVDPIEHQIHSGSKETDVWGSSDVLVEPVCTIPHDDICSGAPQEIAANARLLAAAPEMFEALEAADECLANNGFGKPYVADLIAAVLAKAKGETDGNEPAD